MREALLAACALAAVAAAPLAAGAQTNERAYEDLDFRFVTPGARAVGMGRSFIGLADDATAADSNPAGLSNLEERELAFEVTTTAIRHHRFVGPSDLTTLAFGEQVWTPSFVSYVLPLGRATLAAFHNNTQHHVERFEIGARDIPPGTVPGQVAFTEDGTFGRIAIRAGNYGTAGSLIVHRRLAIGGAAALNVLDLDVSARSGWPDRPKNGTDTRAMGAGFKWSAGALVRAAAAVTVGLAYHSRVTHEMTTTLFGCFADSTVPLGRCPTVAGVDRQRDRTGELRQTDYVIPDRWIGGVSVMPTPALVIVADAQYVRYSSRITDRFQVIDFMTPADGLSREDFSIRDVTELHLGAEYRVSTPRHVLAFRAGGFTDPSHALRFTPRPATPRHENLEFRFNRVPPRTDVGLTVGFGMTFWNRLQTDVAVSRIRSATDVVMSFVTRFP